MRIGFIGAGNMGGALIRGYASAQANDTQRRYCDAILVYDADASKAAAFAHLPHVNAAEGLAQLVGLSDIIVLCVKPNAMDAVLDDIAGIIRASSVGLRLEDKVFVSIAAGISIGHLCERLGAANGGAQGLAADGIGGASGGGSPGSVGGAPCAKAVRAMPNTPAMVGEGMTALCAGDGISPMEAGAVESLFAAVGAAVWVPEGSMDIVTGISGSSPAYAYMYIDALISAGVAGGLPKEAATLLAAQATLGAARMVMANAADPADPGKPAVEPRTLCGNVCSPGGTTIEAVKLLEAEGFSAIVERAAQAAQARSKEMTV